MVSILSGARKYGLGLTLAHQDLRQLWDQDTGLAHSIIANAHTRVCFRLGDFDASKLQDGFSFFTAADLQNLGIGEAICRVERSEHDFNLKTLSLPPVADDARAARRERVVRSSRSLYATKREEVQSDLGIAPISPKPRTPSAVPDSPHREKPSPEIPTSIDSPVRERRTPNTVQAPSPGRGGTQHKYLQQLVRRMAEA